MLLNKLLSNLSVHVKPFAICTISQGWGLHLPGPGGLLLHYVLKGKGTVYGPKGDAHPISPQHLCVIPIGAKHVIETTGEITNSLKIDKAPVSETVLDIVAGPKDKAELIIACGIIDVRYGPSLDLFSHLNQVLAVDLSSNPEVLVSFRKILDEQSNAFAGHDAMTAALMTQCLVHFFRRLPSEGEAAVPWLTALQDKRLGRVVDTILDRPGDDYSVGSMADMAAMSRSSFSSFFMKSFGKSPMNFVNHIRMQHAAKMLEIESTSIDEIAKTVGFSSRSHFSRTFKDHTGFPPREFKIVNAF